MKFTAARFSAGASEILMPLGQFRSLSQVSVLIVDDEAPTRQLYRSILEQSGCSIVEVSGGREAISACRDQFFDFVLADLSLTDMDGLELLRIIRMESPVTRVLMVSSYMRGSMPGVAVKMGAVSVLDKAAVQRGLLRTMSHELSALSPSPRLRIA